MTSRQGEDDRSTTSAPTPTPTPTPTPSVQSRSKQVTQSVQYLDHTSQPWPLSMLYHATASRQLTSIHPPSSVTEIESAYCPQCLQFWDAGTAFDGCKGVCRIVLSDEKDGRNGGMRRVLGCASCPICPSVLSISVRPSYNPNPKGEMVCLYSCGHCQWTSEECDVTVPLHGEDGMEKAIRELRVLLTDTVEERSSAANSLLGDLVKGWEQRLTLQDRRTRSAETSETTRTDGLLTGLEGRGWEVDMIQQDTTKKMQRLHEQLRSGVLPPEHRSMTWNRLSLLDDPTTNAPPNRFAFPPTTPSESQTRRQTVLSSSPHIYPLLPVPLHLRARYVRRCAAELARGRPGILVKPKVNPLEGDSSLRFGHGQWWKKESSAIHIIPRIQIQKHGKCQNHHALLLQINNPTLGMVRLRLHNSCFPINSTPTESPDITSIPSSSSLSPRKPSPTPSPSFDDETVAVSFPKRYEGFTMDSNTMQTASARVIPPCTNHNDNHKTAVMKTVTLESVEDAFLELGKAHHRNPPAVKEWDAELVLNGYIDLLTKKGSEGSGSGTDGRFRVVAQDKDVAWIQYIVSENDETNEEGKTDKKIEQEEEFVSTPLVMDIEIGNGSWETSWIQPIKKKTSRKDQGKEAGVDGDENAEVINYASFTILPVWKA